MWSWWWGPDLGGGIRAQDPRYPECDTETQLPGGGAQKGAVLPRSKGSTAQRCPWRATQQLLERKMLQKQRGEDQAEAGVSSSGFVHLYTGAQLRRLEVERSMLLGQEN